MEVGVAEEGIRTSQEVAWDMDNFQIKICKVKQSLCLTTVKALGLAEVHQVFVVSKDLNREGGSVKVMSPGFQSTDDCEEFSVIDIIVSFSWDE